ncbi:MAG: response regulator [Deltaproteobacteria bacterium]|nr:response regulator [Deltaproteobacteria bacterium]
MASLALAEERYGERKRILVVDDYAPTRNLIREALEQTENYEASVAENGLAALNLFKNGRYDMVISDVMMPGMGGMELLKELRRINPATPVILITAQPAMELAVSAMKNGVVDFLKKPFDIDGLLFKVDLYLRNEGVLDEANRLETNDLNGAREQLSLKSYIYETIEKAAGGNDEIFETIVELAMRIVEGQSCAFLLFDEEDGKFYPKVERGNDCGFYGANTIPTLTDLFREVVDKKAAVMIHSDSDPFISPSLICAPLFIRGNVLGVLSVRKKATAGIFGENDLHHILSLAKRASLNLENKILYESIYANLTSTFKSLVASIQVRDHYTEEHSSRVTEMAVRIAEGLNCTAGEIECLRLSSLLHDIGKIAIPDNILLKEGGLSTAEYAVIKEHPRVGADILSYVVLLDKERKIIAHHHERWDGRGYPDGISGNEIPLLSRILAVADSFDAMVSDRPYRRGLNVDVARSELIKNINTQFDGTVVDVFLKILNNPAPAAFNPKG